MTPCMLPCQSATCGGEAELLGDGCLLQGAFDELLGECTHVALPGRETKLLDEQLSLELHAEATTFSAQVSPLPFPSHPLSDSSASCPEKLTARAFVFVGAIPVSHSLSPAGGWGWQGLRVLGLATRSIAPSQQKFVSFDEAEMVFQVRPPLPPLTATDPVPPSRFPNPPIFLSRFRVPHILPFSFSPFPTFTFLRFSFSPLFRFVLFRFQFFRLPLSPSTTVSPILHFLFFAVTPFFPILQFPHLSALTGQPRLPFSFPRAFSPSWTLPSCPPCRLSKTCAAKASPSRYTHTPSSPP